MDKLFIQTPQFEKVAYKRVSENPSEWIANVMEAFYNQFPSFSNSKVSVNFSQKEESKGYAIGNITIEEGTGMVVPIIIKDRELYPFDVAIINGNTMPLTNATIQMYIENRGAFWKLVKPDAGDITNALFNTSFSQSITPTYMHETYKQAEYNTDETVQEENKRLLLEQQLKNNMLATNLSPDKALTDKSTLTQDVMLKTMQEKALMGGQMKANELFMQMSKDWQVRRSDSLMYMMLSFKKWANDQGLKVTGWDVPGFGKTAGVADWFFEDDVNFLSKHTGIARVKLNETKQKDADRFSKLYTAAKKAVDSGGDVRAALAITMREGGPLPLSDTTQQQAMKVSQNMEPALGVTPMSKQGTLLERIASTISTDMKNNFFGELQKDASIVEGFRVHGTAPLVLKIAAVNPQPIDFKERVRKELERDIQYIYKSGSHEYTGVFGNSKVVDPIKITLDEESAKKFHAIKTSSISIPEMEKIADVKYFFKTAQGSHYAVLANNDYVKMADVDTGQFVSTVLGQFQHSEPEVTKCAALMIKGQFTEPFEVHEVWTTGGKQYIVTSTGLEKKAYCKMQGIDESYTENGITYIPPQTFFVKLGDYVEVPEKILANPLLDNTITKTADNQYTLTGRIFDEILKKEGNTHDLHTSAWHMIQAGARTEDVEKIASMRIGDSLNLQYDLRIPHTLDKVASIMEASFIRDADIVSDVAKHFIKEAAAFEDQQTVDAILSLNFVNKNNILEFVEALPMFAQVSQKLADMLLKARLGVTLIEESAIRRTMLGIVEIMDVLNGVQNLLEKK